MFAYNLNASGSLELSITGTIGSDFANDGITSDQVRAALRRLPNAQADVLVDSLGGSFFEGIAIYQALSAHRGKVKVTVGACAASAASIVAMAGDEIVMHATSSMLIHPVWTVATGNADELRKMAADLNQLSEAAVEAYSSRTKMSADDVRKLMAEDRYMSAEEAKKLGFCTRVLAAKGASSLSEHEARSQIERMRAYAESRANGSGQRHAAAARSRWEDYVNSERGYWSLHELHLADPARFNALLADFHRRTGVAQ